jgi:hypothetical protein
MEPPLPVHFFFVFSVETDPAAGSGTVASTQHSKE